jgi:hypothetical protein
MAQHLSSYRVPALCEALQVSRSGFYRWKSVKRWFVPSIRRFSLRSAAIRVARVHRV